MLILMERLVSVDTVMPWFCKLQHDYWRFIPLKTLGNKEADRVVREFCGAFLDDFDNDIVNVLVYCDAHVCDNYNCTRRHPPPRRPQANSVIERKIGLALEGLRVVLVTGCLPTAFSNRLVFQFQSHSPTSQR